MATEAAWAKALRVCEDAREALEPFANSGFLFADMTLYHLGELIRHREKFPFKHPAENIDTVNLSSEPASPGPSVPRKINVAVSQPPALAQGNAGNAGNANNAKYPRVFFSREQSIARLTLEDGTVLLTAETITEPSQLPAVIAHLRTVAHITVDCEFMILQKNPTPSLKIIQIGTSPTHGYAFIVAKLGIDLTRTTIAPFLTAPDLRRTGFALTNDAHVIKESLDIELGRTLDLQTKLCGISLIRAMEEHCFHWAGYAEFARIKRETVNFKHWSGRKVWNQDPLPDDVILYAVFDVTCLFHLEAAVENHETQPIDHYWPSYAEHDFKKKKKLLGRKKKKRMSQDSSGGEDWYSEDEDLELMMPPENDAVKEGKEINILSEKGVAKHRGLKSDLNISNEPSMPTRTLAGTTKQVGPMFTVLLEQKFMERTDLSPRQPTSPSTAKPRTPVSKPKITPPDHNRGGKASPQPAAPAINLSSDVVSVSWDDIVATSVGVWSRGEDMPNDLAGVENIVKLGAVELSESGGSANPPMGEWDWGNPTDQPNDGVKNNNKSKVKNNKADPIKGADWDAPQSPAEDWNNDNPRWQAHTPDPGNRNARQSSDRHYAEADNINEKGNSVMDRTLEGKRSWTEEAIEYHLEGPTPPQARGSRGRPSSRSRGKNKNKGRSSSISSVVSYDPTNITLTDGTTIGVSMISTIAGLAVLEPFLENSSVYPIIINSQYSYLTNSPFPELQLLQLLVSESPTQFCAFTILPYRLLQKDQRTLPNRTALHTLLTSPLIRRVSWFFDLQAQAVYGTLRIMPGKTLDLHSCENGDEDQVDEALDKYANGRAGLDEALEKYASEWAGLRELRQAREEMQKKRGAKPGPKFGEEKFGEEKLSREVRMNALEALAILKVAEGVGFNLKLGETGGRKPREEEFWIPDASDAYDYEEDLDYSEGDNN